MEHLDLIAQQVRDAPARCGATRLVCVDGPAGSGKTTLADRLSDGLGGPPVVRMDDLYQGWQQPLGQPLAARVEAWLLLPWVSGLPGRHLVYDWAAERYRSWVQVEPSGVVILEGCGCGAALVRRYASVVVWVEAPRSVRLQRGLARDGAAMLPQWQDWQDREDAHFADDGTADAAGIHVDGLSGRVTVRGGF